MSSSYEKKLKVTTVCAAFLASLLVAAISYAKPPVPRPTLSVFEETPGSLQVLQGKYAAAIRLLDHRRVNYQEEYAATNLCVALIMSQQIEKAKEACNAAVTEARAIMPNNVFRADADDKHLLALAYSNRAVLAWLLKQPSDAAEDVSRAHALSPDADFVAANLMVFNSGIGPGENPVIALNRR